MIKVANIMLATVLSATISSCALPRMAADSIESRIEQQRIEVIRETRSAVVRVFSSDRKGIGSGTGTLFLFDGQQVILTAAHVVPEGADLLISSHITPDMLYTAKAVYVDRNSDIAVLQPINYIPTPAQLPLLVSDELPEIGEDTIYSGYPNSHAMLTINGRVSGITQNRARLFIDSFAWMGASGSSIFNLDGELIGVLSAMDQGTNTVGMPTLIPQVVVIMPIARLDAEALAFLLDR